MSAVYCRYCSSFIGDDKLLTQEDLLEAEESCMYSPRIDRMESWGDGPSSDSRSLPSSP